MLESLSKDLPNKDSYIAKPNKVTSKCTLI